MKRPDTKRDYAQAVVVTIVVLLSVFPITLTLLSYLFSGDIGGVSAILVLVFAGVYTAIGIGVVVALWQRRKEIQGGEEEEARKY